MSKAVNNFCSRFFFLFVCNEYDNSLKSQTPPSFLALYLFQQRLLIKSLIKIRILMKCDNRCKKVRIQISLTDKFFSRRHHIPSLKKHIIEVYDPQPQDRPICFWTIAIYGFEHHLFDKNGQRKNFTTRTSNIPNWVSVFVSHSPHFIVLFSFSHTIFLHWVFFLLSMDLTDKQQQQLSLAKCARQRCNEWFVFCSGYFSLFSVV